MGRGTRRPVLFAFALMVACVCATATVGLASTYVSIGESLETAHKEGFLDRPVDTCDLTGYEGAALHLLQNTAWSDHVPTGMPVGRIRVWYTDGTASSIELIEGVNTAEWAYDRPELQSCLQHEKIAPAYSSLTTVDSDYEYWGHSFSAYMRLDPKPLDHLELAMYPAPYTQTSDYGCTSADWFGIGIGGITLELLPGDLDIIAITPLSGHVPLANARVPAWEPGLSEGRRVCAPFTESPLVLQVQLGVPKGYQSDWIRTECLWSLDGQRYQGEAEFLGQLGAVTIPIPPPVRNSTLSLFFRIYGSAPGKAESLLRERSIALPLSVTYREPAGLLSAVESLWAYYAAGLAAYATNDAQVRDNLLSSIYANEERWQYHPNATISWENLIRTRLGNCWAYADLWANLCKVNGVGADSRPIYAAWQLSQNGQEVDTFYMDSRDGREAGIKTKSLAPLDRKELAEKWTFNFHQIGCYPGLSASYPECYDPVFNIQAPSLAAYKGALLEAVRVADKPVFSLDEITGGRLADLLTRGYLRSNIDYDGTSFLLTTKVEDRYWPPRFPPFTPSPLAELFSPARLRPSESAAADLSVWADQIEYDLADPITVLATVRGADGALITGLAPQAALRHDPGFYQLPMSDDGAHGDGAAGDGIYGAVFNSPAVEGTWEGCVSASGMDQAQPFDLTGCVLQGVLVRDLGVHFTGAFSDSPVDEDGLPGFEALAITAAVNVTGSGEYWLRGTLLKDDSEVCYNYAAVPQVSGESAVTLTFPGYLVRSPGMDGPYSVHLVLTEHDFTRIDDADHVTAAYSADSFQQGPPALSPIGDRCLGEGQLLDIQLYASDPEGDPITYSVEPLPEGATLDPQTGRFQWQVTHWQAGTHQLTFAASDGLSGTEASAIVDIHQVPIFPDVPFTGFGPSGNEPFWAFYEIDACYRAGIVAGYTDGYYRPANTVTRAQMAVYIARALAGGEDQVPTPAGSPTFSDVADDFWAYPHIEYCALNNVVEGYGGSSYEPTWPVTRAQMAVFIARALVAPNGDAGVPSPPAQPTFPDVSSSFWAYYQVEYLAREGVTRGYDDGKYHPERVCSRDQMAVYVARAFRLVP